MGDGESGGRQPVRGWSLAGKAPDCSCIVVRVWIGVCSGRLSTSPPNSVEMRAWRVSHSGFVCRSYEHCFACAISITSVAVVSVSSSDGEARGLGQEQQATELRARQTNDSEGRLEANGRVVPTVNFSTWISAPSAMASMLVQYDRALHIDQ